MIKAEVIDQGAFASVMDDYQANLELRSQQYEESKVQKTYEDEEEDDEYFIPDPTKEPTTRAVSRLGLIFCRASSRVVASCIHGSKQG